MHMQLSSQPVPGTYAVSNSNCAMIVKDTAAKDTASLHVSCQEDHSFVLQVTQMKYRLAEGNGECFYFIGETLDALSGSIH